MRNIQQNEKLCGEWILWFILIMYLFFVGAAEDVVTLSMAINKTVLPKGSNPTQTNSIGRKDVGLLFQYLVIYGTRSRNRVLALNICCLYGILCNFAPSICGSIDEMTLY